MNALKGREQTAEHILKRVEKLRGRKNTPEVLQRMSEAHKGIPNKNKGKHFPEYQGENAFNWRGGKPRCIDCDKEISYGHMRCVECFINHTWRGDDVHIGTLHQWIKTYKPKPKLCESCHIKPPRDCANISGNYLRDVNDFEWLCRRCHMLKDGRLEAARARAPYTIKGKHVIF